MIVDFVGFTRTVVFGVLIIDEGVLRGCLLGLSDKVVS